MMAHVSNFPSLQKNTGKIVSLLYGECFLDMSQTRQFLRILAAFISTDNSRDKVSRRAHQNNWKVARAARSDIRVKADHVIRNAKQKHLPTKHCTTQVTIIPNLFMLIFCLSDIHESIAVLDTS